MSTIAAQPATGSRALRGHVVRMLRGRPVFAAFADDDLTVLAGASCPRTLQPGERLFAQGDRCSAVYALEEGCIKLVRGAGSGREKVTRLVIAPDTIGEAALFDGCHAVTAVSVKETRVLSIDAGVFTQLVRSRPRAAFRLLAELGHRLTTLVAENEALATHTAEQRLARFLLEHRRDGDSGDVGAEAWSRRDLASLLAMTPETLSRTLAALRARDLVSTPGRRIRVLDPVGLGRLLEA